MPRYASLSLILLALATSTTNLEACSALRFSPNPYHQHGSLNKSLLREKSGHSETMLRLSDTHDDGLVDRKYGLVDLRLSEASGRSVSHLYSCLACEMVLTG
jgi:hypothetical protein